MDTTEATVTQVPEQRGKVPVQNKENKTEDSGSRQEHNDGGQHGNLLLQNLKEDNFLAQLQQTAGKQNRRYAGHYASDHGLYESIRQGGQSLNRKCSSSPEPELCIYRWHPETVWLRPISLHRMKQSRQHWKVRWQPAEGKTFFLQTGCQVEAIEVTVQTQFEQNLEQGRGNNSNTANETGAGRKRTRRINLNAAFAEEEPQTEEDRIAADMMSANGNTVDLPHKNK